jgi:hypothetical protein
VEELYCSSPEMYSYCRSCWTTVLVLPTHAFGKAIFGFTRYILEIVCQVVDFCVDHLPGVVCISIATAEVRLSNYFLFFLQEDKIQRHQTEVQARKRTNRPGPTAASSDVSSY